MRKVVLAIEAAEDERRFSARRMHMTDLIHLRENVSDSRLHWRSYPPSLQLHVRGSMKTSDVVTSQPHLSRYSNGPIHDIDFECKLDMMQKTVCNNVHHAFADDVNGSVLSDVALPRCTYVSFAVGHTCVMKSSISTTKRFGCSMAAKCPPLSCSRCQTRFPVYSNVKSAIVLHLALTAPPQHTFATRLTGTGASSWGCHEYPSGFLMWNAGSL